MKRLKCCARTLAKRIRQVGLVVVFGFTWHIGQSVLLGQFGGNIQYFAQVVLNDGSTTSFTLHNPSDTETIAVDAQLYLNDGRPLADGQVELGPKATGSLSFGDPEADLATGWARLESEDKFIATEFFQLSISGQLRPRVGVLPSVASDAIRLLGFINPQFKSGLAVTNPSETEATEITIRARDKAGQEPVEAKILMLEPLQSVAGYLNEEALFGSALSNYEGVVEISVNSPVVAAVSLIQEVASGDVATVSVLTKSHVITDENNTAVGIGALASNTIGFNNTASGNSALEANTSGGRNTATGNGALSRNTEGFSNSASGADTLRSNTTGGFNTASGADALRSNTTGGFNTANGSGALSSNTEGKENTASGVFALSYNTTGSGNIAIGNRAGLKLVTGRNNIYVGNEGAEESNAIRIGDGGHFNAFIAGVQVVPASSRRFKHDIQDMGRTSRDLMRLRPVTFRYKKEYDSGDGGQQFGLIAEEVAQVYPELVVYDEKGQVKTVEYQKLPAMLLNELQKQYRTVQEQQRVIVNLTERLSRLEQLLTGRNVPAALNR